MSLTLSDVTSSCDYSYSKLFVTAHNGSFIQSTLSSHGVPLSGCFVRNCKCEKLVIKIILSVLQIHTHTYRVMRCTCSYWAKKGAFRSLLYPYTETLKAFCIFFSPWLKLKVDRWDEPGEKKTKQNKKQAYYKISIFFLVEQKGKGFKSHLRRWKAWTTSHNYWCHTAFPCGSQRLGP